MAMKICRATPALVLAAALVMANCACAQSIYTPSKQMTLEQARAALVESLGNNRHGWYMVRNIHFYRHRVTFDSDCAYYDDKWNDTNKKVTKSVRIAAPMSVSEEKSTRSFAVETARHYSYLFEKKKYAIMFADALYALNAAVSGPDPEEADFEAFTASATTWLETTSKPVMPDDARAYKTLAEDEVNRKDFTAALVAYCRALDKYPMWAEGRFNAALLAGEAEDYELAAHHMRRYLVLVPDATNAVAAKDKLLLWQLRAEQ